MNSIEAQNKQILIHERSLVISKEKKSFSKFIKEKRKLENCSSGKENITTRELASKLDIDYEMFRKILNMNKPTKKRDCIFAICAALRLDLTETNEALLLYNYMPTLNKRNFRDKLLIEILDGQFSNPLTIIEINQRLLRNGYPKLDIIDHRPTEKIASTRKDSRFKLIKKQVRTFSNDLFSENQYDSLATQFDPSLRYRCIAEMWLEDTTNHMGYKLTSGTSGGYALHTYTNGINPSDIKLYKTQDESNIFKDYFLELESMAKREYKNMLCILNDTKYFKERISANILNDNLHAFVETYNYIVPELNEYYLFEYTDNNYRLSVFNTSEFMHCYLDSEIYTEIYGSNAVTPIVVYSSVEDIENLESNSQNDGTSLLHYRKHMFKQLRNKVDILFSDLRERKVFVQHLDYIYNDWDRVCSYYGVDKEFQCTFDSEYGDMMSAGVDHTDFTLPDQSVVTITLQDLYLAFELGFKNIDEICRVKKRLGSIEQIIP